MKKLPHVILTNASLANASMILRNNLREAMDDPTIKLPIMQANNGSPARFFKAVGKLTEQEFPNVTLNTSAINNALEIVKQYYEDDELIPVPPPPPIPNGTTFVSAEVPMTSGGNHVLVTLSDANGYESIDAEWEVKINDEALTPGVSGKNTNLFHVGVGPNGTIVAEDIVTVSHLTAVSGIVQFLDQPVTVNVPA